MYRDYQPYWRVGGRIFYDQMDALTAAADTMQRLDFHFFDDVFARFDFRVEPAERWQDLLFKRAIQLREQYDYLRVWYSGGADSQTMLNTFLRANIRIDEIVLVRSSPSGEFDDLANSEINRVALPFLQSIRGDLGDCKLTFFDIGPREFERLFHRLEIRHFSHYSLRPTTLSLMQALYPAYFDRRRERIADVQGGDKPKIALRPDGEFYAFYYDIQPGMHLGCETLEQFFVSPDLPQLHIKQCHLVKRHFQARNRGGSGIAGLKSDLAANYDSEVDKACRDSLFIDYSLGKSKLLQSRKSLGALEQLERTLPQTFAKYQSDLQCENGYLPERFNEGDILKGFYSTRTKEYSLGY